MPVHCCSLFFSCTYFIVYRRQENTERPAVASRREPTLPAPDKSSKTLQRKPPAETASHVGNSMMTFLQKLKEDGQSKLARSRKTVIPVEVPAPEPEDNFIILEDDTAFQFSIPCKNAPSRRQQQSRSSTSDEAGSAGKEDPQRGPQNQDGLEKTNDNLASQAADKKTKAKKKEKGEKNDERPESAKDEVLSEQEKPNKKKNHLNKVKSKVKDTAKSQVDDEARSETRPASPSQKAETNAHKSSEAKKTTSSKTRHESIKTAQTKPSKGTEKREQRSEADEEPEDRCDPAENDPVKSDTNGNAKQSKPMAESAGSSSEDNVILQKRKRKPPGQWWKAGVVGLSSGETDGQQPTVKRSKQKSKETNAAALSPVKDKKEEASKKRTQKEIAMLSQQVNKAKGKEVKRNKKRNKSEDTPQEEEEKEEMSKATDEQQPEEEEGREVDQDQGESSPLVFSHRDQTIDSGPIFQKVYHRTPAGKISTRHAAPDSHRQPEELLREAEPGKRRRKPAGSWWMVNDSPDDVDVVPPKRRQPAVEKSKPQRKRKEQPKKDEPAGLSSDVDISSKPAGDTPVLPLKPKSLFTPKTVKSSLAKFTDIFKTGIETPVTVRNRDTQLKNRRNVTSHPTKEKAAPQTTTEAAGVERYEDVSTQGSLNNQRTPQDDGCHTESTSNFFRSGPSSMIELQEYEEIDDTTCLTSGVQAELSPSDLCGPPLKPLVLQPKDKSNLAEWFKCLWSTATKSDAVVTPDQFDWYFYQDKAMGLQVEQNAGSFCSGKMMLGSQMKKPLWVDHSATTVFNVMTSSVSVIIDGSESCFNAGQSFMVNCGRAYSIRNVTSQPAMLLFTRMSADGSDCTAHT
uniref:Mif2/CENP-C cupin domain-containing protein n=1 Tax=Salarias fasciatus TaxID=181472 RepID=A0A672G2M0_SALFA